MKFAIWCMNVLLYHKHFQEAILYEFCSTRFTMNILCIIGVYLTMSVWPINSIISHIIDHLHSFRPYRWCSLTRPRCTYIQWLGHARPTTVVYTYFQYTNSVWHTFTLSNKIESLVWFSLTHLSILLYKAVTSFLISRYRPIRIGWHVEMTAHMFRTPYWIYLYQEICLSLETRLFTTVLIVMGILVAQLSWVCLQALKIPGNLVPGVLIGPQ